MAKRWFSISKAKGKGADSSADIAIYNEIGYFGVTADDFSQALNEVGEVKTLNIAISSDGGDVSQGFAIFNMLQSHKARKVVTVQGLAASMASVIAMAGDEIVMPSNSMMMIHNPWGAMVGEAEQMRSFADALSSMEDSIAEAYRQRAGGDIADIKAMMDRETWLSAKKAVELGFADRVETPLQIAASFNVSRFNNLPRRIAAQASTEGILTMTNKNGKAAVDPESESADASTEKTAAEIRKEALAYAREIRSLCNLAGFPKMADKFIDDDKSLSEVVAALEAAKAKGSKGESELQAQNDGHRDESKPVASIDVRGIYSKWNKTGK